MRSDHAAWARPSAGPDCNKALQRLHALALDVLASAQTDCLGVMTHADWGWPSWSPNTYHTFEVTFALIARLRAKKWYSPEPDAACDPGPSLASANAVFRRLGDSRSLAVRRPRRGVRRPHRGFPEPSTHLESTVHRQSHTCAA